MNRVGLAKIGPAFREAKIRYLRLFLQYLVVYVSRSLKPDPAIVRKKRNPEALESQGPRVYLRPKDMA